MLKFIFSENFLSSAIMFSLPIAFAAMAALISNKAGILNINIEGSMSMAALTGSLVSHFSQSWILGLLAAVAAGIVMSFLLAFSALKLNTNSILSGIALNTLASGLTVYLLYLILGVKGDSSSAPSTMTPEVQIPLLSKIPILEKALFSQNILFYIAILMMFLVVLLLNRTKLGMEIKATGYNEKTADSVGINTVNIKLKALLFSGILAGLGGAYLSMAYLSYFSAGMISGRGFIGLAAESMGAGRIVPTMLFSLLFGAVDYFAVGAQAVLGIPYELLNTFPYLMTVLALVIYALISRRKTKKPDLKGVIYETSMGI